MKKLHGEVRFHLSNGPHYMFWQLKVKQGGETVDVYYYDPKEYQLEMRVLALGYEGGYNDTELKTDSVVFNTNDKDKWYYGPHESARFVEGAKGTQCLIITRGK